MNPLYVFATHLFSNIDQTVPECEGDNSPNARLSSSSRDLSCLNLSDPKSVISRYALTIAQHMRYASTPTVQTVKTVKIVKTVKTVNTLKTPKTVP